MTKFILVVTCVAVVSGLALAQPSSPPPAKQATEQEKLKSDYLLKVSQFIHNYDKQMFAKWITIGKTSKFRERLNQDAVRILVKPDLGDPAEYRPGSQTIVIKANPAEFTFSLQSTGKSSLLLWHEAIHAISHGHQNGAIQPSHPFKGVPQNLAPDAKGNVTNIGKAEGMIDHYYINWAESCIGGLPFLVRLEKILLENGKTKPSPEVKTLSQRNWRGFLKSYNSSIYGELPGDKERKELEDMTGFHCDANEVLSGYLNLGYPMEYFGDYITDAQVWKLFPTSEQLGITGANISTDMNLLKTLCKSYSKKWCIGPPGRNCTIHLSLYGSPEISKVVWDGVYKSIGSRMTAVPGVGEAAFVVKHADGQVSHAIARQGNAQVMMTDINAIGDADNPVRQVIVLPINWNYIKRIFLNIEALPMLPIPVGVETSLEKLKAQK
jgi:hypothetical protein